MDPGGTYPLRQDPDFWEAMKNQYKDSTALLIAKEQELKQKITDMEAMLSNHETHDSPFICSPPSNAVPKVFPQMSVCPVKINVPKVIRDKSPVRFMTPPPTHATPSPCLISAKKESYSSNFFQKVMENAKSILTMRCNVVTPCSPINEKPTKDDGTMCPCAVGDRQGGVNKTYHESVAVGCDDANKTEGDNTSQEVNTSYSCTPSQSANVMTDTNNCGSSPTTNLTNTSPGEVEKGQATGDGKNPCKCKHSLNAKSNEPKSANDGSKKKCTNDTCPVIISRSAPNMTGDDVGNNKDKTGGKDSPDGTKKLAADANKGDCSCDMQTIRDLVEKERQIRSQIQSLQERGRSYDNLMGDFHNMASKTTCTCCTIIQQPGGDFDKISTELKLENKQLRNDLDEMKMELRHCLDKIQGPMKEKLEIEKCKCLALEDELNKTAKNMIVNHESHTREMNAMKLQLCNACNNISELNSMNRRLKDEMDSLDCMCAKLEDDLMRQKISEAETIKRLTRRRPEFEEKTVPAIQSSFRCDSNLDVIARKLSSTLRETEPCEECAKLPPELTSAARCIRDLTDMVQQRKKEVEAVLGKTRESGSQSPRTEDAGVQCCKECIEDDKKPKTLYDVSPTFPEKDSQMGTTTMNTPYFSAEGMPETLTPPPPTSDLVCKRVCDDSQPCKVIGTPCAEGGQMTAQRSYGDEASRPTTMAPAGSAMGAPGSAIGAPGSAMGAPGSVIGAPGSAMGAPGSAMGAPESVIGAPISYTGAPGSAIGAPGSAIGAPGSAIGAPGSAIGAPGSAIGAPGSAMGAPESAMGAPESAMGAPGSVTWAPGSDARAAGPRMDDDDACKEPCGDTAPCSKGKPCFELITNVSALGDEPQREGVEGIASAVSGPGAEGSGMQGAPSALSKQSEEVSAIPLDVDPSKAGSFAPQGDGMIAEQPLEGAGSVAASGYSAAGSALGAPSDMSGLPPGMGVPSGVSGTFPGDASGMGMGVPSGVSGAFPGSMAGQPDIQGGAFMGGAASGYGPASASGAGGLPFKEQRTGNFPFEVETRAEVLQEPPPDLQVTTTITASGTLEVITEAPGGVIETTLTYRDDGTLEVLTQLTEGGKAMPAMPADYTTSEISEVTPTGVPMAIQESIVTAGDTDMSGGLETVSERSRDTTITSVSEIDKVSEMAGTGKISDTGDYATEATEAEKEEVSEVTYEMPVEEAVEEEVVVEEAVPEVVEEEAVEEVAIEEVAIEEAPVEEAVEEIPVEEVPVEEEAVEEAPVEEIAVEEAVEEVPVEEAEIVAEAVEEAAPEEILEEVPEEVEAAPEPVEEAVVEVEAAPEEVVEEAPEEAAPEEVVEAAPEEAEAAPEAEEVAVEEAAPEEVEEAAEEAPAEAPAEPPEEPPAEPAEEPAAEPAAEPAEEGEPEKIGKEVCVCPGRPTEGEEPKEEEEAVEPAEAEPEVQEETAEAPEAVEEAEAVEAAEAEGPGEEEAPVEETPAEEAAEGEAPEEAATEDEPKPRRRDVCLCDFDKKPKEEGEPETTEGESTDEGADKAIAEGEPSTEPTEEGEAATEGEAILEAAEEEGAEVAEGAEKTEGEEGAEKAEGEEGAEKAEGEEGTEKAEGEESAEAAEAEEAVPAEAKEPTEEDLSNCREIVEDMVSNVTEGEFAVDTSQKRDYSCQSTAAVDQSCQCCECKNVGVSTTQDSETVTDDNMVQEAQKSVEGPEGDTLEADAAEAGDLEEGKVQGTAEDVTELNEESKCSAPCADGDASEYTTAQDKSIECTATCATPQMTGADLTTEAKGQTPLIAAAPSDAKGKCSQFINEESLEPCQEVGIQCDCAGEIEKDDRSEGRVSSGSDTENEMAQMEAAKKSGSEVPESVSKLAAGTSKCPSQGSTDSGKPRKRRSSRLHNIRCDCPGVCQCVVCAPDVIAKRKAMTGSPLPPTGQAGKLCCCLQPRSTQRSSGQRPTLPPMQLTQAYMQSQMPAHPTGCECGVCTCNCTPGPRGRTSINDVFNRPVNAPMDYQHPSRSQGLPGHPANCECVDCLCMPTVRCLANLREVPIVKDEKQIYQVKCVCAKKTSKIPIPTNSPLGPPKAKANITCTCEKCSCSPCLSKGEGAKPAGNDLSKLCDCKDCQCTVCFNKPKKDDRASNKGCCCKGDCTCDSCPVEKLAKAGPTPGGGGGPGHPEGCDCTDCLCPKSPEFAQEADAAADAPGAAKKQPPPGCDCVECKCPGMAGDDLPKPEGCDCFVCACPGREAAVGGGKKMAECDCSPCECSPCADPKKRPEEPKISPCDCPDCKCEPCADPSKSKRPAGHSALCDCPECVCEGQRCLQTDVGVGSVENKATHTPDCICDECLCDTEQHESGCTCPECQCTDCIYKTDSKATSGGDECKCGDCQCKDCAKKKSGGDGCTCAPCECTDCIYKKGGAGEDECKCGDCKCVDCSKKAAAPADDKHGDDCDCSDCFFKRRNEAEDVCKCGNCLCVDCPKKKDGGSSKGDAPAAGAGPCSCIVCECDVCSDPNKKKAGGGGKDCTCATCECTDCTAKKGGDGGGCSCKECKCDNCMHKPGGGKKADGGKAVGKDCTCATCLCVDCADPSKKKANEDDCTCVTCECTDCTSKKGGDGGDCTCKDCKCEKCAHMPAGAKKADGGKAVGKGCTCTTCICVDCAGQKADKSGDKAPKAAPAFTDPPPFTVPVKDPCKCAKCDCVLCSKGGTADQCTCPKCECKPCTKKGGGGSPDPPPFAVPSREQCTCKKCDCVTCSKGGGSGGDGKTDKCSCPKCECAVCPKGGGAKASGGDGKDKCTCKKCECSPCTKGGPGKGGSSEAPAFEIPIREPCTCKVCDCISCNKSYVPSKSAAASATVSKCDCSTCTCTPDEPVKPPVSSKSSKANAGDICTCAPDAPRKPPVSGKSSKANAGDSCTCPKCMCDECPKLMGKSKGKANISRPSKHEKGDLTCACPSLHSVATVSKMGNAELMAQIKKDTKENCECREQIKELKRALDKIKCACTEAEAKASKNKPFIKQASAFGQTMSGLKVALANLQDKCKAKDKIIAVMTDELKLRTSSNTIQKVMNTNRCADALDYDRAADVQTIESMSTNVIYAVGDEREMGHTRVRPKSSECQAPCKDDKARKSKKKVKSHKGKDGANVDLAGFEVVDIRRITQDSIIIKWKPPKSSLVTGYDIFINGVNRSKVMSGGRTSAMIHSLDLSATIQITIYAVTKCGRCEPPAIAIYEIGC